MAQGFRTITLAKQVKCPERITRPNEKLSPSLADADTSAQQQPRHYGHELKKREQVGSEADPESAQVRRWGM